MRISDSIVELMCDFEIETSYAYVMGTSSDSHLPPLNSDPLKPYIITMFGGFDSERVYGNSFKGETSSSGSLYSLSSNVCEGVICVEVHIPDSYWNSRYKPICKGVNMLKITFNLVF